MNAFDMLQIIIIYIIIILFYLFLFYFILFIYLFYFFYFIFFLLQDALIRSKFAKSFIIAINYQNIYSCGFQNSNVFTFSNSKTLKLSKIRQGSFSTDFTCLKFLEFPP